MSNHEPINPSRRRMIRNTLFGAGMLGLRSLASGIPVAILANPRKALADGADACIPSKAQYLIFSTSGNGDPMNGNVPGTYTDPNIVHPLDPSMAATPMTIGGQQVTAAKPWAELPSSITSRSCFFHHGTYTVVHPDEHKVLGLMGQLYAQEMFVSMVSKQLSTCLGTVQKEPVSIANAGASETVFYEGRPQPMLNPVSLASVLTTPTGPLANLQAMRDSDLNKLNAFFKSQGNKAQQDFIDRYAQSQTQARSISQSLLSTLSSITDNSPASQVTAAIALIQMKVSPVVTIHIPFGGDNHFDTDLAGEAAQTVAGVGTIAALQQQLTDAHLQDQVSFMAMNVFGRTMNIAHKGTSGRDHHGDHHCTVLIGKGFAGKVIGGVEVANNDFRATSFNSTTGAAVPSQGGDVLFTDTLGSMGKTVGVALGLDPTFMDTTIANGKVVPAALAT